MPSTPVASGAGEARALSLSAAAQAAAAVAVVDAAASPLPAWAQSGPTQRPRCSTELRWISLQTKPRHYPF